MADLPGPRLVVSVRETKRGKASKPGAPSHDDLVQRVFTADVPNQVWVADITEHWTDEGKLHCCAIKDLFSNGSSAGPSTHG